MKTIKCKCESQGLLLIGVDYIKHSDSTVPSCESGFAHYEFKSAESLFSVASDYYKIERSNGNIELGKDYTIRKAKNDFNALAVEREIKTDVAGIKYTE